MLRAAEYLKKLTSLSLFFLFFIADESYFNTCQDDNGCPNVLFDVSSLKSKWERKSDTEGERERNRGKTEKINGNKREGERGD